MQNCGKLEALSIINQIMVPCVGVGTGLLNFLLRLVSQLPWEFEWLGSHGKNGHSLVSTCWFPDTFPTSKPSTCTWVCLVVTNLCDVMLKVSHATLIVATAVVASVLRRDKVTSSHRIADMTYHGHLPLLLVIAPTLEDCLCESQHQDTLVSDGSVYM